MKHARVLFWILLLTAALPLLALAEDSSPVMRQYEAGLEALQPRLEALASCRTHPCINITTLDGQAILSKDEYVPSVVDVFNCDEAWRLTAEAGVKVRGNSTANDDEKPYRIKFTSRQSMLGLHDGQAYKSWVLLRSSWNVVPDYTAFRLGRAILDDPYYVSDCMFVNLSINGELKGVYLLCEQNQAARGRVTVYEPEDGETGLSIGYLLELDNYPTDEHPVVWIPAFPEVTDLAGQRSEIRGRAYSIKSDTVSPAQRRWITNWMNGTFTILYEASVNGKAMGRGRNGQAAFDPRDERTPWEAVCAVMDMDSLAEMLILEELTHNYDVGEGSFYMAVDFSRGSLYPRLTFMAPWDFNWAYDGDPQGGWYAAAFQPLAADWDRSNGWFVLAMRMPEFRELVRQHWRALREDDTLETVLDAVDAEADSLRGEIPASASWRIDAAHNVVTFVRGRIAWLDSQFLEDPEQ